MGVRDGALVFLFGILWLPCICHSANGGGYTFVKEAKNAPAKAHYDYIIVGGGTAGCPLAATLSQNFSVLLLERGGSPYGNANISRIENFGRSLMDSDDLRQSPSQAFVSEDGVVSARGRVLGGGSCLNAGFYSRASPLEWRELGLDARLVQQSYAWVEKVVAHEPPSNEWQSAVAAGLVEAGIGPYNGFTYDHIYGTKFGGTIFDKNGHRSTAADLLRYADPRRLTVLLRATVHRVLFTGKSKPRARGVVFRDSNGSKHVAYLKTRGGDAGREIVISAGALGSPQLLMLSGIGPAGHLRSLGIPVLVDQPQVGQGMADNSMNAIIVPSPAPVKLSLIQVVGITKFGSFIEASSGFGVAASQGGFQGGYILEKIVGPLSKGRLLLRNVNVEENPTVRFNYFEHPLDLKRCVEGLKTIERVIRSKHFRKFTYPNLSLRQLLNMTAQVPINLRPKHSNDSTSLGQLCKDTVTTIWHYHGGCQVGRVVDRNYRVVGVDGLRVIDGSTWLFSPGTNPQASVMMLGRYMGVKMLREALGRAAGVSSP